MKQKKAIRVLESIEYYLKTHTNESCEEEHTAIALAKKAIRIVDIIEACFKRDSNLMMDYDDWADVKKEAENDKN